MTWRNKRDHFNNYTCKWRRSKLGKTNPNHHYFARLIKKETNDYLDFNKEYLLANKPEIYYSMKGQKLPKKYQDPFRGMKPTPAEIIPVKIREKTDDEIKREKEKADQEQQIKKAKDDKFIKQQQVEMKEKQRKEYNRITFEKQQKLVHWCNPYDQGNYRNIHSDEYRSKTEKKYEYY
jgi:hypothetical protein